MPNQLDGVYLEVFEGLEQHGLLGSFRVLHGQRLVALAGTQYHSSDVMHCHNCLRRHISNSRTLLQSSRHYPSDRLPRTLRGDHLAPECIMPQDGHAKQDCERVAGKRWIDTQISPEI